MIQIDMKMPSSCYDCPFVKNERTNDYGSFCECGVLEDYETINLLEHSKSPNCPLVEQEPVLDKINGYVDHIRNTGMGKKKSLESIEKFIEWLRVESEEQA